jgi:hypothetical protein
LLRGHFAHKDILLNSAKTVHFYLVDDERFQDSSPQASYMMGKDMEPQTPTEARFTTAQIFSLVLAVATVVLFLLSGVRSLRYPQLLWAMPDHKFRNGFNTSTRSASKYAQLLPHQPFVVTGVQSGINTLTGERPLRKEITEFQKTGPAFDLYIQCQSRIMAREQQDILSYYEIAGAGYPRLSFSHKTDLICRHS